MKHEYHKKIITLEQEIKNLEKERNDVLHKTPTGGSGYAQQAKQKVEEQFRNKLKDLEKKLKDFKQKEKE